MGFNSAFKGLTYRPSTSHGILYFRRVGLQHTSYMFRRNKSIAKHRTLTFKNLASYIWDGGTATLQMLHFIYIFQQIYVLSILNMLHTPRFCLMLEVISNVKIGGMF